MRTDLRLSPGRYPERETAGMTFFLKVSSSSAMEEWASGAISLWNQRTDRFKRACIWQVFLGRSSPGITDFVNLPTPVYDSILLDGEAGTLSSPIERSLDMKAACFTARFSLTAKQKTVDVVYSRFLPKEHPALILQRLMLIPHKNVEISVASGLMTDSCNSPIPDDQTKENTETIQLSLLEDASVAPEGITADFQIRGTGLSIRENVRFRSTAFQFAGGKDACRLYGKRATGETLILDKAASILTSRDVDPRLTPIPDGWGLRCHADCP